MRIDLLTFSSALIASALFLSGCEKEDKNAISMSEVNNGVSIIVGSSGQEYEVVDLGLPTGLLWAKCNLGATSPEQSGHFYSWGELQPKTNFNWSNYKLCNDDQFSFTKYSLIKDRGYMEFVDEKTILEKEDDAVNKLLGGNWQIPSKEDYAELLYRCDKKFCKLNKVWGCLFTSKQKGYEENSIFIPLAGRMDLTESKFAGKYGFYWSTGLDKTETAFVLWLDNIDGFDNAVNSKSVERYLGLPIRPVTRP